ncbi:unnamed protein product [Blepharisma stoltei]|uniref:Centromere protein J C-terminal domain-containing protein n=1 Tax=Blepharisma stoltei TaxID=1481888 RepID=A0AAU9K8P5_9CILI|nr:unnamed protein product [Blepharisma stoltei]
MSANWESYNYDPAKVLEIQASYLRFLASLYPTGSPANASNPIQDPLLQSLNNPILSPNLELQSIRSPLGQTFRSMSPPLSSRREAKESPERQERPKNPYDDVPVKQVQKTFEELLEEQLNKENGKKVINSRIPAKKVEEVPKKVGEVPKKENPKRKLSGGIIQQVPKRTLELKLSNIVRTSETTEETQRENKNSAKNREKSPPFLKRGQGQLCSQIRAVSSPKIRPLQSARILQRSSSIGDKLSSKNTTPVKKVRKLEALNTERAEKTELAIQIEKFKRESLKLKSIADELEKRKKKLEEEEKAFHIMKKKEMDEFESWKKEETKKIHMNGKKINSKEDEVEALKRAIQRLQDIAKTKDAKYEETIDKLKKHIDELNKKVKFYENKPEKEISEDIYKISPQKKPLNQEIFEGNHKRQDSLPKIVSESKTDDGKIQRVYSDGKKEILFTNGVRREIFPNGYSVVYYSNNDIKQNFPDGKIIYFYSEAQTTQTTMPDGLQIYKFSNGQIEKHFPDGTREITFPDGTIKCVFADGEEETVFTDGTIQKKDAQGVKYMEFPQDEKNKMPRESDLAIDE